MKRASIMHDEKSHTNHKSIWGWMFFDWAAQPFTTLIITFIFAPYFVTVIAPNPVLGQELWIYTAAIGGIFIALMAPILGALSDTIGPKKPWIFAFAVVGMIGSWSLWYITPDASNHSMVIGLMCFIIAMAGFEFATVFNNAMMPKLAPRNKLGQLSGNATALGFAGGLISLAIVLIFFVGNPDTGKTLLGGDPIFGLNPEMHEGERAVGPITAIWFLIFLIPLFMFTPDTTKGANTSNAFRKSLSELYYTIKSLRHDKSLLAFLSSSMLYRDALNGILIFGGIYAAGVLTWTSVHLGIFGITIYIASIMGCIIGGGLDNRVGTKNLVSISICVLIIACILLVSVSKNEVFFIDVGADSNLPDSVFYVGGCLIGAAAGCLQSSSRPLLVDQVKIEKIGEAFGLYALTGRATAFIAPLSMAFMTGLFDSQRAAIVPILILFVIGLLLLIPVRSQS